MALPSIITVLVIGHQHTGKSSFINTIYKYLNPGIKFNIAISGKNVDHCTVYYEGYTMIQEHVEWEFFDTAGKKFTDDSIDKEFYTTVLKGIKSPTNILLQKLSPNNEDLNNRIDHVLLLIDCKEIETVTQLQGKIELKIPFLGSIVLQKEKIEVSHTETDVKDYGNIFEIIRDLTGFYPIMVLTKSDAIKADIEQVKKVFGTLLPPDGIFPIQNAVNNDDELPQKTHDTVHEILSKIIHDMKTHKKQLRSNAVEVDIYEVKNNEPSPLGIIVVPSAYICLKELRPLIHQIPNISLQYSFLYPRASKNNITFFPIYSNQEDSYTLQKASDSTLGLKIYIKM